MDELHSKIIKINSLNKTIKEIKKNEKEVFQMIFNKIQKDEYYAFIFLIKNFNSIFPFSNYNINYSEDKIAYHNSPYNYNLKSCKYESYGKKIFFDGGKINVNFDSLKNSEFGDIVFSDEEAKIKMIDYYENNIEYGFVVKKEYIKIIDYYFAKINFVNDKRQFEYLIEKYCLGCKFFTVCDNGNKCKKTFAAKEGEPLNGNK